MYRQTLRSFPTAAECCAAIDALYTAYQKAHKRKASVALCYSLVAAPDPNAEKPYYTKDTHSITVHAEDVGAQMEEVLWFDRAAQAL